MILPARPLLLVLTAWFALGIAASVWPQHVHTAWRLIGIGVALITLLDGVWLRLRRAPLATRVVPDSLPLSVWTPVELRLQGTRGVSKIQVFDHVPRDCEFTGLPAQTTTTPDTETRVHYRLRPLARGDREFGPIEIELASSLHLWRRRIKVPATRLVRVYPNFAPLTRHALLAADVHSGGMLKRRRRGEGLDFEQLREYRQGDTLRQIDWKATRRVGKFISREYQDERDQRIVLLADCGRRMGARDDALSHFDHVLDALLLFTYIGLRQGDAVGLMTLGGVDRYLAPHKSRATVNRILHTVYDLQPTLTVSDFESAATTLVRRLRRRALVVIFTNLRDEDDASLIAAVRLLAPHHLVLVASLRERALDEAQQLPAQDVHAAGLRAAAVEYRRLRETTFARLRQAGVLCLDAVPQELAVATVNRYLAIKAEGRL